MTTAPVKYSSEWWRQQPGASGRPIDYSASQGHPSTNYRTPYGQSINTTIGSQYRPIGADGAGWVAGSAGSTGTTARDSATGTYAWVDPYGGLPTGPTAPRPPGGYPTGGGGGGGGGGAPPVDVGAIMSLMNRKPQSYQWNDLAFQEYIPSQFRDFNSGKYDLLRQGLTDAIGADRTAGNAQYDQLRAEMGDYQNPWANPTPQTTNPAMSTAMQRMFDANGTPTNINQADTDRGIQADQAFGNLLAVLGMAADQEQGSRMRSIDGYQRNLGERLDAEQRGGTLAVGMSEAQARELYEQEKWQFGESVAQMNYLARTQNQQYNNQGQNTTAQNNTQMANEFNQSNYAQLIELIASGVKIDPAVLQSYTA